MILRMIVIALSLFFSVTVMGAEQLTKKLSNIHQNIVDDYDNVDHIHAEQLLNLDKDDVIIFDVREKKEYQVSHLDEAIQVDPSLGPEEFLEQHGEAIKGKIVIYYCSVGRRSSKFASRVNQISQNENYNLTGGIFHWRNAEMPLVDNNSITDVVHPYNLYWGRLVEDKSARSYQAKE